MYSEFDWKILSEDIVYTFNLQIILSDANLSSSTNPLCMCKHNTQ